MKPTLVAMTIIIAVVGIVGITFFTNFDANKVPIGFMDINPLEKEVSDSFDDKTITKFIARSQIWVRFVELDSKLCCLEFLYKVYII